MTFESYPSHKRNESWNSDSYPREIGLIKVTGDSFIIHKLEY